MLGRRATSSVSMKVVTPMAAVLPQLAASVWPRRLAVPVGGVGWPHLARKKPPR